MTKINKKILILSVGMISCISMPAYAQWSVADVNLPRYSQAIINELGGVRGNQQNQMKQNSEFQEDTDRRTRIRDGQRLTYERNVMQIPTLQQCAEMTERDFAGASARASGGGSGYNSSGGASKQAPDSRRDSIINNATALANTLVEKNTLGTCAGGMDAAIQGCGSGAGPYANADNLASSLSGNRKDAGKALYSNLSLDDKGQEVAKKYANDSSYYAAPKTIKDTALVQKNPTYVAMYQNVMRKLNAVQESFYHVSSFYKSPKDQITNPYWNKQKDKYQEIYGVAPPDKPSMGEIVAFNIANEYYGKTSNEEIDKMADEKELLRALNKKLALNNFMSWQQYRLNEKNTILLGHILTQMTTPASIDATNAEHAKTLSLK